MTFEDFKALVYRTYGNAPTQPPQRVIQALTELEQQPYLTDASEKVWYDRLGLALRMESVVEAFIADHIIHNRIGDSDE